MMLLLILLLLTIPMSSMLTLCSNYKYYHSVFQQIQNITFYQYKDLLYIHQFGEDHCNFVWFMDTEDICLTSGVYIHNITFTYFDPYSLYWLKKYQKFFRNLPLERIKPF